jgi:hypothetical protein
MEHTLIQSCNDAVEETETFEFQGCKFLCYHEAMTVPRQGISLGQKALCYARFDPDGILQLVQYCKRGRMNFPEAGITKKCCSDYEEIKHIVVVPISELNSSPRDFKMPHASTSENMEADCPFCHGRGGEGIDLSDHISCPQCEGTGKVIPESG